MKRLTVSISLSLAFLFLSAGPLQAFEKGKASIAALDETTFVVVAGRGADNSSVLLYKVVDGKLHFLDALVVDGNFGDISRPTVRVLRASQHP